MGRVEGKVALVTGAARGQGRSHAVRLAEEGADIIAIDNGGRGDSTYEMAYEMPGPEDLETTASEIRAIGRQVVTALADVRDQDELDRAVEAGTDQLGGLDIVVANAGIVSYGLTHELSEEAWTDVIDVNLSGVWRTCKAAIPTLISQGRGGAMVLTSSVVGLKGTAHAAHYIASKHGVVGLMRSLASELGEHGIRVNSVHPTQVNTAMIMNETSYKLFSPDLAAPTEDDFAQASQELHLLPIPFAVPRDISEAVLFLVCEESRMITGVTLPVDAGLLAK